MLKEDYIIRKETIDDYYETENVVREAFWNVYRPGCTEHFILHTYREKKDFEKELDLVMVKNNKIIGQIMYSKASINLDDGRILPIMTFGPISILPEFQRKGYGKILLEYSIKKAKRLGVKALCIEGNIEFYGKSGFEIASNKNIYYNTCPRNEVVPFFLVKEIQKGALEGVSGVYNTPQGYFIDEEKAEKFDMNFKPKKKLILDTQIF